MNRDELLTKLAMELGEWPASAAGAKMLMPLGWYWRGTEAAHVGGGLEPFTVHVNDWLQRRAELINKPSWDDAPEWAQWLAQDDNGMWMWYKEKPSEIYDAAEWQPESGAFKAHSTGTIPNGHDWRETLEQRPSSRGNAGGTLFRAAAVDTGLCSDGAPCGSPHNPDDDQYCIGCPNEPMTEEEEEMTAQTKEDRIQGWLEDAISKICRETKGRCSSPGSLAEDLARIQANHRDDSVTESWRELAEQNKRTGRSAKQARYQDENGDDWIDEFARTATPEEFRGAMRFTIGKYNRRMGRKDDIAQEVRKMRDYCDRWLSYEDSQ